MRMGAGVGPDESRQRCWLVAGLGPLPAPAPPAGVGLSGFEAAAEEELRRVGELLRAALGRLTIASDGVTSLLALSASATGQWSRPAPGPSAWPVAAIGSRRWTAGARCSATRAMASPSGVPGSRPR